jgi:hypothetical protein
MEGAWRQVVSGAIVVNFVREGDVLWLRRGRAAMCSWVEGGLIEEGMKFLCTINLYSFERR